MFSSLTNSSGPPPRPAVLIVLVPLLALCGAAWTARTETAAELAAGRAPAGETFVSARLSLSIRT